MPKRFLFLFLIFLFLNGLVWISLVPLWHFPDEQSHFAQVAFIVEKGRNPNGREFDLTEEIYVSEQLLGTLRDKAGNNKFTFHPEYKIEYTDSFIGKYEASISALANTDTKTRFVKQEASRYPLLYYLPAAGFYKLLYKNTLFIRVFIIRFWSLLLFAGTVIVVYKMGKVLFSKDKFLPLVWALLVGFQPMMFFANVGVNSDALGNFIFSIFLYCCLRIIIWGFSKKNLMMVLMASFLSICTKQQFAIVLPIDLFLFLFVIFRDIHSAKKFKLLGGSFLGFFLTILLFYKSRFWAFSLIDRVFGNFNPGSLMKYTIEYTLPHTFYEVLPWYWGIYNWLGVTYPRIIHKIINRLIFIAGIGILIWIYRVIRNQEWKKKEIQGIIFLNITAFVYFLAISFYDWLLWYSSKYPLGVQGRYFFPVISTQMLMLLLGWQALFPKKWRLKELGTKILEILMILLNFYGIYTILKTYYNILPISTLIVQIGQYKPWFFKGPMIFVLWFIYLISMMVFLLKYICWFPYEKKK